METRLRRAVEASCEIATATGDDASLVVAGIDEGGAGFTSVDGESYPPGNAGKEDVAERFGFARFQGRQTLSTVVHSRNNLSNRGSFSDGPQ